MRDGARQLDVAHAIATHFRERHFYATLLTDNAAMLQTLVLTAEAFVVLHRAKDLGAEETIALRLECPIVNCFRLLHFAE